MKRSPLKRKTPLKQGGSELKRSKLRAISPAKLLERDADAKLAKAEAAFFKLRIKDERCVVCGKTEREAFQATGFGHEAHHGIPKSALKKSRRRSLLWDPENAVPACLTPCHVEHTDRNRRIKRAELPPRVLRFAVRHGLVAELLKEYPE